MSDQRFRTISMIILCGFVSISLTETAGALKTVGGVSIEAQNIGGSSPRQRYLIWLTKAFSSRLTEKRF